MTDALWGVLLGGAVTFAAVVVAELIRTRNAANLDREGRTDRRRAERDVFQRETLLALQKAVNELARTTFLIHSADLEAFQRTNQWRTPGVMADELAQANRLANSSVSTLGSLVIDDDARQRVYRVGETAVAVAMSRNATEADENLLAHALAAQDAAVRCGELARNLF